MRLLVREARVVTVAGTHGEPGVLDVGHVVVEGERIVAVGAGADPAGGGAFDRVIEAGGRVVMPAFVDAHTHACWAGSRVEEWAAKVDRRSGAAAPDYLATLRAGGGIMATVRAVRAASEAELAEGLAERLWWMLAEGTLAVEVKSGYGLTTDDELKMLRAIAAVAEGWPGVVVPTACIGHAIDPEQDDPVGTTIRETLPAVTGEFPGVAVDAYCESGAWSLEDCLRLFDAAMEAGHPVRVHADQFNALGMVEAACERGYLSVDHLEATGAEGLRRLGESGVYGVLLPCSGFHLDGRYADGRGLLDAGGRVVVATNCNPGSAPTVSVPMAMALAVRHNGLTPGEALRACTGTAADLLGLGDRGRLELGRRADLLVLRHRDERSLAHEFGGNLVRVVVCGGEVVADHSRGPVGR